MSSTTSTENVPPPRLVDRAAEAVTKLNIEPFLKTHIDTLLQKLVEADVNARVAPVDDDMLYVVLSLPIASSVIHLASSRQALADARNWVQKYWEDADPSPILSTLTLVHLVMRGYLSSRGTPAEEVWDRIAQRIKKLTEEMAEELRKHTDQDGASRS